ncbi:DUF5304 family protein, partial [Streptomyces sp. NPDC088178]
MPGRSRTTSQESAMSEATDRPVDDDAWAKACAEDLEAEKARRR